MISGIFGFIFFRCFAGVFSGLLFLCCLKVVKWVSECVDFVLCFPGFVFYFGLSFP